MNLIRIGETTPAVMASILLSPPNIKPSPPPTPDSIHVLLSWMIFWNLYVIDDTAVDACGPCCACCDTNDDDRCVGWWWCVRILVVVVTGAGWIRIMGGGCVTVCVSSCCWFCFCLNRSTSSSIFRSFSRICGTEGGSGLWPVASR